MMSDWGDVTTPELLLARIIEHENEFRNSISAVKLAYYVPLRAQAHSSPKPAMPKSDVEFIFGNFEQFVELHDQFAAEIADCDVCNVGDELARFTRLYMDEHESFHKSVTSIIESLMKYIETDALKTFIVMASKHRSIATANNKSLVELVSSPLSIMIHLAQAARVWNACHTARRELQLSEEVINKYRVCGDDAAVLLEDVNNYVSLTEIKDDFESSSGIYAFGRKFIMRSNLAKLGRTGVKKYIFYLFGDCLLYGTKGGILGSKKMSINQTCNLKSSRVQFATNAKVKHGFEFRSVDKSFAVICSSDEEAALWVNAIQLQISQFEKAAGDRSSLSPRTSLQKIKASISGTDDDSDGGSFFGSGKKPKSMGNVISGSIEGDDMQRLKSHSTFVRAPSAAASMRQLASFSTFDTEIVESVTDTNLSSPRDDHERDIYHLRKSLRLDPQNMITAEPTTTSKNSISEPRNFASPRSRKALPPLPPAAGAITGGGGGKVHIRRTSLGAGDKEKGSESGLSTEKLPLGMMSHPCCVGGCTQVRNIRNYCIDHAKEYLNVEKSVSFYGAMKNNDEVYQLLSSVGLEKHFDAFISEGFDRLVGVKKMDRDDFEAVGMNNDVEIKLVMKTLAAM